MKILPSSNSFFFILLLEVSALLNISILRMTSDILTSLFYYISIGSLSVLSFLILQSVRDSQVPLADSRLMSPSEICHRSSLNKILNNNNKNNLHCLSSRNSIVIDIHIAFLRSTDPEDSLTVLLSYEYMIRVVILFAILKL